MKHLWETLEIVYGSYPCWRPYSASFAVFAQERDQLPVTAEVDFFLCLPSRLLFAFLIAHLQPVYLVRELNQREVFVTRVYDLLFLSTGTGLVPFLAVLYRVQALKS